MTINWWTLGLQALNVLILVWLLSRVFWRPLAKAIAARQSTVQGMLEDAETARASAADTLTEVTTTRAQMASEREALLAQATTTAAEATKAALADASHQAETLLQTARVAIERERAAAYARTAADAAVLGVDIARKLLLRLDKRSIQAAFLDLLVETIDRLPPDEKKALIATPGQIDLVSALELDDAARTRIGTAVGKALGVEPRLNFLNDADLLAGFEMRTTHFVVRNSWQSDLSDILRDLQHAA